MSNLHTGNDISMEALAALKLPKHTISFKVNCSSQKITTIECEYHPETDIDLEKFGTAFSKHALIEIPPEGFEYCLVPKGKKSVALAVAEERARCIAACRSLLRPYFFGLDPQPYIARNKAVRDCIDAMS